MESNTPSRATLQWRIVERIEDGRLRRLLQVDGEEYLHVGPDDPEAIEARAFGICFDRIVDFWNGDRA